MCENIEGWLKVLILGDIEWLVKEPSKIKLYRLENHIIVEYGTTGFISQRGFKIYDLIGKDLYSETFETFNQCLVLIALNVQLNDTSILQYLKV